MQAELVKLSAIKPNTSNPRTIKDAKFKKLVQSIKEFPQMLKLRPIVVDEEMVILGGNMRFAACKEAGLTEVYIIKAEELTEEQKQEFIIKDNVGFGEWDWDILANEWNTEDLENWGLDLPVDLSVKVLEAEEDDFDVPEGGIKTDIVLGDLFEIGEHRLLCGDSTQTDTFEKLMQGELADMVVTDPPYNVAYEGGTKEKLTIENDSMSNDDFYKFLYDFYTALSTSVKKGGAIYVWHASSEVINFGKAMVDAGWLLKQQLIWVKNSMVMGRQDYQWKHEPCLYGWLKGDSHKWYSDRKQTTIIEFDRKQGDIVIDAFGGSGTTMIACEQLNRKARIIEFDPRYCQVIIERIIKMNPDLKVKKNGEDYTL